MLDLMDVNEYCFELSQTLPLESSEIESVVDYCLSNVSSEKITLAEASEAIVNILMIKVENKSRENTKKRIYGRQKGRHIKAC